MTALADMVLRNPDLLQGLPPTSRRDVLTTIAASGGDMPNRRRETLKQVLSGANETIRKLETLPGFESAVGTPGASSFFGLRSEPLPGSEAADYVRYLDTLKSQLTLPKLELMRGLGAMSDREFKTVSDAVSALDRRMSEKQFKVELQNIKNGMAGALSTLGMSGGGPGGPTGPVQWRFNPATGKLEPVKGGG